MDYVDNRRAEEVKDREVANVHSQQQRQELSEPQIVILTQRKQDQALIQQMTGRLQGVYTTAETNPSAFHMETQTSSAKRYTLMQLKQLTKSKMTEKDLMYKSKRKAVKVLTPISSNSKETRATVFPSRNHTR